MTAPVPSRGASVVAHQQRPGANGCATCICGGTGQFQSAGADLREESWGSATTLTIVDRTREGRAEIIAPNDQSVATEEDGTLAFE